MVGFEVEWKKVYVGRLDFCADSKAILLCADSIAILGKFGSICSKKRCGEKKAVLGERGNGECYACKTIFSHYASKRWCLEQTRTYSITFPTIMSPQTLSLIIPCAKIMKMNGDRTWVRGETLKFHVTWAEKSSPTSQLPPNTLNAIMRRPLPDEPPPSTEDEIERGCKCMRESVPLLLRHLR